MSKSAPHGTEEYFCRNCEDFKTLSEVNLNWRCPVCNNYVEIRIVDDIKDQCCFRIPVTEIVVNDMVLINRQDDFRTVLGTKDLQDKIQLNLAQYGAWKSKKDESILKLDGAWCH